MLAGLIPAGCNVLSSGTVDIPNDNGGDNVNNNTVDNGNVNDNANDNADGNVNDNGDDGPTTNFAVFAEPDTGFSTTDVRDVDDEIVRFDTTTRAIVWAADNTSFDAGFWPVDGVFLGEARFFQVRFGTQDSERRAYFTETSRDTICNLAISGGQLQIFLTNTVVPQE